MYYFAIGIAAFMRTMLSQFIGFKDSRMVKKCVRQIVLYHVLLMLAVSGAVLLSKDSLSRLFFADEETRRASDLSLTVLGLNVVPHSSFPVLSGALRWACQRVG